MKKNLLIYTLILIIFIGCDKSFVRKHTLIVLLNEPVQNLNPFNARTYDEMMISSLAARGLFYYDYFGKKVRKGIVKKYSVSKTGKEWTFHLKNNLKTWGGEKINAKFLYNNFTNILSKSYKKVYFTKIQKVEIIGDLSIKVYLKKGDFNFNALLCGKSGFGIIANYPGRKIKFEGYGPYIIKKYTKKEIILEQNPDYKESRVETKRIIFRVVENEETRFKMLVNREADIATFSSIDKLNYTKNNAFLRLERKIVSPDFYIIASKAYPFDKQKIRKAVLGHSLIRNKLNFMIYNDFSKVNVNILPEYSLYHSKFNHLMFYNPANAKKLLSESKINGFKFKLHIPENYPRLTMGVKLWIRELKENNIDAVLHKKNMPELLKILKDSKFGVAIVPLNNWIVHPVQIIGLQNIAKGNNLFSKGTQANISKALASQSRRKRRKILYKVFKDIILNAKILGVIKLPDSYITTSKVQNMKDLLMGRLEKVRVYH